MKLIQFAILFEPRDMWVGVFWDATWMWNHYDHEVPKKEFMIALRVFITIIPMFPLRIVVDVQRVKAYLSRLLTPFAADAKTTRR